MSSRPTSRCQLIRETRSTRWVYSLVIGHWCRSLFTFFKISVWNALNMCAPLDLHGFPLPGCSLGADVRTINHTFLCMCSCKCMCFGELWHTPCKKWSQTMGWRAHITQSSTSITPLPLSIPICFLSFSINFISPSCQQSILALSALLPLLPGSQDYMTSG